MSEQKEHLPLLYSHKRTWFTINHLSDLMYCVHESNNKKMSLFVDYRLFFIKGYQLGMNNC